MTASTFPASMDKMAIRAITFHKLPPGVSGTKVNSRNIRAKIPPLETVATKAVTGAEKEDCFVVATPRLTTLIGEQDLTMEFDVAALALDGSTIHSAKCVTPALAQVQGGGESGCGCDMKAEGPADFANLVIGLAALIPLALMAGIRKRAVARK